MKVEYIEDPRLLGACPSGSAASNVTVAILAQGTSWAVAVTQAFCPGFNSSSARVWYRLITGEVQELEE